MSMKLILKKICEQGETLTRDEARRVLNSILAPGDGTIEGIGDVEIASLLTALAARGETADELTGFAEAMRALAEPVPLTPGERDRLVDTCGTGGDGKGTFNISTAAALVAAGAGAQVAKHGNRGVTSKCGSADVLEALGIPVALTAEQSVACLRATGFTFLYAPALHPSMKRVQPVRRALGFRTIFNLAGPLTNPAAAPAQVVGVYDERRIALVAESIAHLGIRHAFVVHGADGLDELTISGESTVAEIRGRLIRIFHLTPEDVGLERATLEQLQGGDSPAENAAILERVFGGERGPHRDIVLFNAAAALLVSGLATDLVEGISRAGAAIDCGAVTSKLESLREFAHAVRG